jgi:hypothetical protein
MTAMQLRKETHAASTEAHTADKPHRLPDYIRLMAKNGAKLHMLKMAP